MPNYTIITDSGCDLPNDLLEKLDVKKVSLSVLFQDQTRPDSVDEGIKEFYDGLRAGDIATTSAVNPEGWKGVIEPAFEASQDALVLAFSSGLSTTYQSAVIAAEELMEQYPDRKAYVVDTLCASLGEGFDNETMFISHGDCLEDAEYLADILKERCGVKHVHINHVGAVIGSHAGPGVLALFFLGKHR